MNRRAGLVGLLFLMGAGWGATQPLGKIAVSTGYPALGIVLWQLVLGACLLGAWKMLRGGIRPIGRVQAVFAGVIAMIGTILPNCASFVAVAHLPAGVMSIVIAAVPMVAFPIALAIGIDRFSVARLVGLGLGIVGVALLAQPASLPGTASTGWLLLALIAPVLYAVEANVVAKNGTYGLDPVALLFWASLIGTGIVLPLALATGQFIPPPAPGEWGAQDWSVVASSVIHAVIYAGYVWLLGRAGAVFAGQVGYLVTGFGVIWAILFLGEVYPAAVWLALALILSGVFLVQPREAGEVAGAP